MEVFLKVNIYRLNIFLLESLCLSWKYVLVFISKYVIEGSFEFEIIVCLMVMIL